MSAGLLPLTQELWFAILWTWAGGIWFGADTRERSSEPAHGGQAAAGSAPLLPKEPLGKFTLTQAPTEQSHLHSCTHNVAEVFRTHGASWWRKASPRVKNTQNDHVGTQVLNIHEQQRPTSPERPLLLTSQLQVLAQYLYFLLRGRDNVPSYLDWELWHSPWTSASLLIWVRG